MNDYILRATIGNGGVRAFIAITTETVEKARQIHDTSPVATAALGRMLTAAAIMGAMLKNEDDIITLSIKSQGPLGNVVVTSNRLSQVKGYVSDPQVELPLKENGKLDVSAALGEGSLSVIIDVGLKEPYVGQVPLVSGEIAEDLTYYYAKSEQIPSAIALGVLVDRDYTVKQAGGFILQVLPEADEEVVARLEENVREVSAVTQLLEEGKTAEEILSILAKGMDYAVHDMAPTEYACNCDRDRVEKALISVGLDELNKIITEDKQATLHCHFCNRDYHFSEQELREIVKKAV